MIKQFERYLNTIDKKYFHEINKNFDGRIFYNEKDWNDENNHLNEYVEFRVYRTSHGEKDVLNMIKIPKLERILTIYDFVKIGEWYRIKYGDFIHRVIKIAGMHVGFGDTLIIGFKQQYNKGEIIKEKYFEYMTLDTWKNMNISIEHLEKIQKGVNIDIDPYCEEDWDNENESIHNEPIFNIGDIVVLLHDLGPALKSGKICRIENIIFSHGGVYYSIFKNIDNYYWRPYRFRLATTKEKEKFLNKEKELERKREKIMKIMNSMKEIDPYGEENWEE